MSKREFALNRKQAEQFVEIVNHFKDVEWFTFVEENTEIGPIMRVQFKLFDSIDKDTDTTVDITDLETW